MASFRNRRIVIASLFLPTTAVQGEAAPTPVPTADDTDASLATAAQRLEIIADSKAAALKPILTSGHTRQSSNSGPLKSIVEDLKDKSRFATPPRSPTAEAANPFQKLRFAADTAPDPVQPAASVRKAASETSSTPRLRRKQSRSQSRRPASGTLSATSTEIGDDEFPPRETWHFEANAHCNGGLKNAVDSVSERMRKKLWVGTLGTPTDTFSEALRRDIDETMMAKKNSLPVWIPDDEFQSCYDEFCHQVLWPCLHYAVPDAPKTKLFYESASFKQYVAVNQRFADAIVANYQEGDIIWVNDYHLMLLPALLRASLPPSCPIGFFMHVAFPSSEIFRCLSVRKPLLKGVLGADLVGFQTASYARHFRQTVSRIMSYEALPKGIQVPEEPEAGAGGKSNANARDGVGDRGRFVDVGVFPMGIDVKQLHVRKRETEVLECINLLLQRYSGMKILVGRDKLDEIQGVRHKLNAFETFLERHPSWQGKVVLIQVALHTSEVNELQAGGVADIVSRINSRFSTLTYQPVIFLHTGDLTFSQYLGLLSVADAFIVTSLREGMALRTHEFVECQEGRYRPLILSEFTGSYSYSGFRSCIAINPWDRRGTAEAIHQALTMPDDEARSRWEDLHNHVTTQTAQTFVTLFLNRCLRAHTEHEHMLDIEGSSLVPELDLSTLTPRYKHSTKRIILVDFEGTLWRRDLVGRKITGSGTTSTIEGATEDEWGPFPESAIEVLGRLADDRRNEVWLLSGLRTRGTLEGVARRVPKVGIVAENGCFIKTREVIGSGGVKVEGEWINMVNNFNLTWKNSCFEILNYFTERTPGSFIEEREASMVWRFWTGNTNTGTTSTTTTGTSSTTPPPGASSSDPIADRQWAQRQAAEAQNHIFDSLGERYGLRIIPGTNSFLVLPNNVSRSTAVGAILHPGGPARMVQAASSYWRPHHSHSSSTGSIRSPGSSPLARRSSTSSRSFSFSDVGPFSSGGSSVFGTSAGLSSSDDFLLSSTPSPSGDGGASGGEIDFLLAISSDEKLLRRLNEFDGSESVSTSGKGTDARWRLASERTEAVLRALAQVGAGSAGGAVN